MKDIIYKPIVLLFSFITFWFFGIIALFYALTLTDSISALAIWGGGGLSFFALRTISDLFRRKE